MRTGRERWDARGIMALQLSGVERQALDRTGPAVLPEIGWVSSRQATGAAIADEDTLYVRGLCHGVVECLPNEATDELLRLMSDMLQFYCPPAVGVDEQFPQRARLRVTRWLKSVRPEITIPLGEADE